MASIGKRYSAKIESQMRAYYESLNEKDRRRYAAIEATKLDHGGIGDIAEILGCSRHTIERGLKDLERLPDDDAAERVRRPGAGRKPKTETEPELENEIKSILQHRAAGDPMDSDVLWTDLTLVELADQLSGVSISVSPPVIKNVLRNLGCGRRKIQKTLHGGTCLDRDDQFHRIADLKDEFLQAGQPIFSMDTKNKEYYGRMFRDGQVWCERPQQAFDHDFPSWAEGKLIPHGIYDVTLNLGHLNLGLSHDTSEFACDSFDGFWRRFGLFRWPDARRILLLCDAGGSNNHRHWIFKWDLQRLVDRIGLPITVAHYPTYCSKFNPADRRFFPHVTRACQGVLFDTVETAARLMRRARTAAGLRTTVKIMKGVYETGRTVTTAARNAINLTTDTILPRFNYTVTPTLADR